MKAEAMPIELLRGTRDYDPEGAIKLREITSKIEEVFKRFGFYPIETPSLESTETLNAKAYGQEARKEMYTIDGSEAGLIYDLTVPLARYFSSNRSISLPFKRYQIGRVWRREEPQKMRSRELIQADADIVGSAEPASDAEVIASTAISLESVGLTGYTILLSSRVFLSEVLSLFKVPQEKQSQAITAIDKLEKITAGGVREQLLALGIDSQSADSLLNFIAEEGGNSEKLHKLATNCPGAKAEVDRMLMVLGLLSNYHLNGEVKIDLSLARGLDYYTGAVWEFVEFKDGRRLPTIAAGGRYDRLIGIYAKTQQPAVGSSIGISRIYDLVQIPDPRPTYAAVYVANIGPENLDYAMTIANFMRAAGIYTDLNLTARSISKQLEYANSMKVRYAVIVGTQERAANKVRMRDMSSRSEELLSLDEAISKAKG